MANSVGVEKVRLEDLRLALNVRPWKNSAAVERRRGLVQGPEFCGGRGAGGGDSEPGESGCKSHVGQAVVVVCVTGLPE